MEVHCVSLLGQQQHSYTWRSLLRLSAAAFPCYKRCKLLCALAITLVLISQCLSFWHSQIDQEALRYRWVLQLLTVCSWLLRQQLCAWWLDTQKPCFLHEMMAALQPVQPDSGL